MILLTLPRISTFYILVKLRNRKKKKMETAVNLSKRQMSLSKKKKKKKKKKQQLLHNLVEIERERVKLDKKFQ